MKESTFRRLKLPVLLLISTLQVYGQCNSTCAPDGKQNSGAIYRVCMPQPSCYNGNLVIYAHGYVDAFKPVTIPEDQLALPDGVAIPELINKLGFAFATTSYSRTGLAILEGVRDVRDLVHVFAAHYGNPQRIYLVGPSEGGLVTAKSMETYPGLYAGGVAACGPVGNFQAQINYMGDFRVLFNYYFPGVIPGSVTQIPQSVIDSWSTTIEPTVREAVRNNPGAAAQLIRVAGVSILKTSDTEDAIVRLAWYSVFATNDARQQLEGQPFDNIGRWYWGSNNDFLLNLTVERLAADSRALTVMQNYETTGRLSAPLVTIHTTADPVIPYWHEWWYGAKVAWAGSGRLLSGLPVTRFGHCQFNAAEVLLSFGVMLLQSGLQPPPQLLSDPVPAIDRSASMIPSAIR
ncbi:MAG TPA: hypothetical protein VEX68_08090 [Bryobacteraceae bacterium]|nr:hypothetical protein [Bryobacteraceae bacterium]